MLVHIVVRNPAGEIHVDKVANEAEAQRVFNKAIEKSAIFSACHHKTTMPTLVDAAFHEDAVKAAHEAGHKAGHAAGFKAGLAQTPDDTTAPSKATPAKQSKK